MIWIALLSGVAVAAGFWLLIGSVRRPPPTLALPVTDRRSGVSVASLRSAGSVGSVGTSAPLTRFSNPMRTGSNSQTQWEVGRAQPQSSSIGGNWSTYRDLAGDLRIVDYTLDYVIYQQILLIITGFVFPVVLFAVILPVVGFSTSPLVIGLAALALAATGFYVPIHTLARDAANRRREFAAALSHYVSFVDVLVSGGNSIDGSFEFAADLGRGWVWDELRFAIASASRATLAPYRALKDLGDELGVIELTNLARRLEQTQSTGAAIGPALRSLADGLAKDQARQVKIIDDEVTEKMTFPLMVVLCSLLTFFGIAAVTAILRAAQGFS